MTGKEAALWALSGTMGDQTCLRTHLQQPPHTVLLDHRAHVQCWESGALPVFSQASVTAVHPSNGVHLALQDVKKNIIADGNSAYHNPYSSNSGFNISFSSLPANAGGISREYSQWNYFSSQRRPGNLQFRPQLYITSGPKTNCYAS
jgi:hypothetical protein